VTSKPHTKYLTYSTQPLVTNVRTLLTLYQSIHNVAAICRLDTVRINEPTAKRIIRTWKQANQPSIDTYIHIDKRKQKQSLIGDEFDKVVGDIIKTSIREHKPLTNQDIKDEILEVRTNLPHGQKRTRQINLTSVGNSTVKRLKKQQGIVSRTPTIKSSPKLPEYISHLNITHYHLLCSELFISNHTSYIHPNNIINADETLVITEFNPHKVLQIKKEKHSTYGSDNKNGQRVALLASITAAGNKLASLAVVSGKTERSLQKISNHQLDTAFVQEAYSHNIRIIVVPKNQTGTCQPLDVKIFGIVHEQIIKYCKLQRKTSPTKRLDLATTFNEYMRLYHAIPRTQIQSAFTTALE
jgi:hypothetical protein